MLYFIPAWYQQNQWCENEQYWYVRRMHTEFDDTVKQIQLFHRNKAYPYQIMLLGYAPNFRHFLHRQGVLHAPYWSCFDAIQEIRRKKAMVLSYHNMKWPADTEFIYSPYAAIAMRKGEKYAQIEFGEDGNPIQIDMYENEVIKRRNIYDDRGFVSSTILYEAGTPVHQDYLTEDGIWKLREYMQDGHVEINPKKRDYRIVYRETEQTKPFSKVSYESMGQVIYEVLLSYLEMTAKEDIFCVAMHERHAALLQKALKGKKKILSFFTDRYDLGKHPEVIEMIESADYVITDSKHNSNTIQEAIQHPISNLMDITPFDSRVDFGISQQLNVQKILFPVDGICDEVFEEAVQLLAGYLLTNDNARVHLFTRQADYDRKERLLQQTRTYLAKAGFKGDWAKENEDKNVSENRLEENNTVSQRFFVEQCVDELSVSKCIREQRIMIDMRKQPELYLQISCISTGIPQIVCTRTSYVEHKKNGLILSDIKELPEAIDFYLKGLANWNEAMVYSYELGKQFTTNRLLEDWKEVINTIG